jgi:hypothetical protein
MDKKGLVPALIGLAVGLGVLYLTVRVISSGWKAGK